MRSDTRVADPHRTERDQITAGAAGSLGAVAAIVLILINAPQSTITAVISVAVLATVLAVSMMVTRSRSEEERF